MFGKKRKKKGLKVAKFIGDPGFTYPFGYTVTDPYLFLGKWVISVFDIAFQYGTNNPAPVGWVTRLIPRQLLTSGTVIFIQRQQKVPKSVADKITGKTMHNNASTMLNTNSSDAKENSKNSSRVDDIDIAAALSKQDVMIDSDVKILIKGKTPKDVENVVRQLRMQYKANDVHGIMLVRRTGEQLEQLKNLLVETSGDAFHNTDMDSVAAGRLFTPSAGFSDAHGTIVGVDVHSMIANNSAIIDFSNINNAVVYMGGVQPYVSIDGFEGGASMQNGGVAVSHVIADGNYLNGGRTHHIVLSHNDYHTSDSFVFDMSKEAINPFEVFGTPETVKQDANANFDKVNTMFLMAAGVEDNDYIKNHLKKEIMDWFIYRAKGNGIYTEDPDNEPVRAQRILAGDDHENYPVPGDFLLNMNNMVSDAAKSSPEERREAKLMYETLSTLVSAYPSIFNKTTTLPNVFKAKYRNIYYDLSNLGEDQRLTSISFLNVLAYVTHRALPGEMIVIDGLDEINLPVDALMNYKKRMDRKGIKLISVFEHINNPVNPISYENFCGRLSQQDMVVLGGITADDAENFSRSWQQDLPGTVVKQLIAAESGILYFYRKSDRIGALIDTHLIL